MQDFEFVIDKEKGKKVSGSSEFPLAIGASRVRLL
jgi:hypothetical protein